MLTPHVQKHLDQLTSEHLLRICEVNDHKKSMINFCSNDYLNLSQHPDVIKAYQHGVAQYGLGSGASAQVSGYTKAHLALEEAFAAFLKRDKALLFNSGYHANLGVITTFANRTSTIVADKLCHASLIDGIVLSRAKHKRYTHQSIEHANTLMSKISDHALLITESVFSMQGSITHVKDLAAIANTHRAMLIVDDAHGIGTLGKQGGGICEYQSLSQTDVPCLITPLGKALGSYGGIVSGSRDLIETIMQCARTHRYCTALPPAICCGTLAALRIVMNDTERRDQLQSRIRLFTQAATERNLSLISNDETPIKSIMIGDNQKTLKIQQTLANAGFLISCIRPPTVPKHQARIRISLRSDHTEHHIIQLLDLIKSAIDDIST